MLEYEIRILHHDRTTDLVLKVMHFADSNAVHHARKIADGRPFEVWRDLDCIHGARHKPVPDNAPTQQVA